MIYSHGAEQALHLLELGTDWTGPDIDLIVSDSESFTWNGS